MNTNVNDRKKESYKIFDEIAPTYDFLNHLLSFGIDIRWRKKLLTHLPEVKANREGLNVLDSYIDRTKKERKLAEKRLDKTIARNSRMANQRIARVEMGLPPDLEEQGVPMKTALGLLGDPYKPDLPGYSVDDAKPQLRREVIGQIPEDESGRNYDYLRERKRRVVHGPIARRNPELYTKSGGAGSEETVPSVLKQIARQRRPERGGSYES